ncbi:tripartite tricarboxylate transporter TctB family protein [Corynebacterium sp. HMSC05E07]|uniref:tripartite tricarboxylate transporter TctB family protein n=1 Tax=Corynebacterium sp. HMSC05E07 TaxID=1581117 RepID=UPI0008A5C4C8|nr:tripartite tricarboxylate transporter TctB family protein [Corynebacterium sp. HMSC05E07]OFT63647.1 hypothetical protein HMPREF3149_00155 [Corynebacterium sp. HMSC05E07]
MKSSGKSVLHGRSEFVMVALLATVAVVLIWGSLTMDVLSESKPGPQFTPMLLGVLTAVFTVALAIDVVRRPEMEQDPGVVDNAGIYEMSIDMLHDLAGMKHSEDSMLHEELLNRRSWKEKTEIEADLENRPIVNSDWRTLGAVLASVLGFIIVLPVLGWVLAAAALFWLVAHFLGSSRPIFDIWVSLIVASVIQLIFGALMGLNLPTGFVGGI